MTSIVPALHIAASSPVVEETFDVTVVIGRFQLPHKAHLALIKKALNG